MDPTDPRPTDPRPSDARPSADASSARVGWLIQIAVVSLVIAVSLAAILIGGRDAPELVQSGGPFTDDFETPGPLSPWWQLPAGEVVVDGTTARVSGTAADGSVLALRRHGLRRRSTSAVLAESAEGAGLLLGYRDPTEYWALVASPSEGTWLIVHVQEGTVRERFTTGPAPTGPGTTAMATIDDQTISVQINGGAPASVTLTDRLSTTDGLVLLAGGDRSAGWERFEVAP